MMRWVWGLIVLVFIFPGQVRAISSTVDLSATIAVNSTNGSIRIIGDAFPNASVTFLVDDAVAGTATANSSSQFDKTINALSPANHKFSIFAEAGDGRRTLTISFNTTILAGLTITVSGLILPAIISVPTSYKRPAPVSQTGLAKNNSTVTTFTDNTGTITKQTSTNANGEWSAPISNILHLGDHTTKALVQDSFGTQSEFSEIKNFTSLISADLNIDSKTNLTDFSILMFDYAKTEPINRAADINDDGPTNLIDFSVMMFYWTGL